MQSLPLRLKVTKWLCVQKRVVALHWCFIHQKLVRYFSTVSSIFIRKSQGRLLFLIFRMTHFYGLSLNLSRSFRGPFNFLWKMSQGKQNYFWHFWDLQKQFTLCFNLKLWEPFIVFKMTIFWLKSNLLNSIWTSFHVSSKYSHGTT